MCVISCQKYYRIILKYYIFYLQFTTFLTSKCTKDLTIEVFFVVFNYINCSIIYKSFYDNSEIVSSFWIFSYTIWMNAYIIKNHYIYFFLNTIRWETLKFLKITGKMFNPTVPACLWRFKRWRNRYCRKIQQQRETLYN